MQITNLRETLHPLPTSLHAHPAWIFARITYACAEMENYGGTFYKVVHSPTVSLPGTRKSMNAEAWMFSFWLFEDVIKSRLKHDSSYIVHIYTK